MCFFLIGEPLSLLNLGEITQGPIIHTFLYRIGTNYRLVLPGYIGHLVNRQHSEDITTKSEVFIQI